MDLCVIPEFRFIGISGIWISCPPAW